MARDCAFISWRDATGCVASRDSAHLLSSSCLAHRANPKGHVTASAVIARPDASEFLLVHHRKLARWLQPGGHTESSDASAFDAEGR